MAKLWGYMRPTKNPGITQELLPAFAMDLYHRLGRLEGIVAILSSGVAFLVARNIGVI